MTAPSHFRWRASGRDSQAEIDHRQRRSRPLSAGHGRDDENAQAGHRRDQSRLRRL